MRFMIAAHHARVVRPIDAGDAEADRGRAIVEIADRLLHHLVEDLLDLELADGLQVRAAAARLRQHLAALVGELTDRLGPARVDAQYVNHSSRHTKGRQVHLPAFCVTGRMCLGIDAGGQTVCQLANGDGEILARRRSRREPRPSASSKSRRSSTK